MGNWIVRPREDERTFVGHRDSLGICPTVPDTVQLIGNYRGAILPGGHSHSFPRYPRASRRVSLSLRPEFGFDRASRAANIYHRFSPIGPAL